VRVDAALVTDHRPVLSYGAWPQRAHRGAVVLLPDVRGLHAYYEDLADSFAMAGFATIAVDLYGPTAAHDDRGEDFDWHPHAAQVTTEHVEAVVAAAAGHLRRTTDGPVFCVGFCFGGGHAWNLANSPLSLAGVIGFYGLPELVTRTPRADQSPTLLLLAEQDAETPRPAFDRLAAALSSAGAPVTVVTVPDTVHSFFDRSTPSSTQSCHVAWHELLSFTRLHSGAVVPP
jgi:carboxymethylenebutenolidase